MIQVTTRNRPDVLEYSIRNTREHYDGFLIIIDDNSETKEANQRIAKKYDCAYSYNDKRRGIPLSKERGFRSLLSFDHQIWLDDDCYLRAPIDPIIEAMEYQGHILYLHEWAHIFEVESVGHGLVRFNSGTACFMTFRKDMYDDMKGFQAGFTMYGHWHNILSRNMAKHGLGEFVSLEGAHDYIHSFDLDGAPDDFGQGFSSCMTSDERRAEIKKSKHWHK